MRPTYAALRLVSIAACLGAGSARAVPPFARRYQVACNTCHVQPPQLNAFGEAFRMNGYQWPENGDEQGKIKDTPVVITADAYREVWPDFFLPSDIPNLPAIGFSVKASAAWTAPNRDGNVSLAGPPVPVSPSGAPFDRLGHFDLSTLNEGADLFVFGRLGPELTYVVELGFYSPSMTFAIERALIAKPHLLGEALNIKVGRFEPEVTFLTGFRKLVGDNYDIMSRSIGEPSGWSLEPAVNQSGVEANGILLNGRLRYNAAVLEPYTGIPSQLGGTSAGLINDSVDSYFHLETKVGGLPLDGRQSEQAEVGQGLKYWVDDAVWASAYAYHGTHDVNLAVAYPALGWTGPLPQRDELWRVGADLKVTWGSLWLIGAVAFEHHSLFAAGPIAANEVVGRFASLEAEYIVYPWLIPYLTVDFYNGTNPYLVNGGWGAPAPGATSTATITEVTVRPAVSIHLYQNWKMFAWFELTRFPLKADLGAGEFKFNDVVIGTRAFF